MESLICLLALLTISASFLSMESREQAPDLPYSHALLLDSYNVLHISGGLDDEHAGNLAADAILAETGLCMEFDSTQITSGLVAVDAPSMSVVVRKLKLSADGTYYPSFYVDRLHFGPCKN